MDLFIFMLLIWTAQAAFCYSQARKKNRDTFGWILLGLLFGFFACIIVAVLPELNKKEEGKVNKVISK